MCPYAIVTKYVCSYRCVGGDATTPREHLCDLLGGGLPQHLLGAATHAVCAGEGAGEAGAGEAARGGAREVGDGGLWGGPEALSFSSPSRKDEGEKKKENESPAGREGGVPPIPGAHALGVAGGNAGGREGGREEGGGGGEGESRSLFAGAGGGGGGGGGERGGEGGSAHIDTCVVYVCPHTTTIC
jgi:hypothetical protein